jgi:hypothetical protein
MRVLHPGGPKDVWLQIKSFKALARDCVGVGFRHSVNSRHLWRDHDRLGEI